MDNPGYKEDELAATSEIPAPFASIVLVSDPKSTGSKPLRAKDVGIRQSTLKSDNFVLGGNSSSTGSKPKRAKDAEIRKSTLKSTPTALNGDRKSIGSKLQREKDTEKRQSTIQSMVNTEDKTGARRTETVVYGHRGQAEVTFINIEIERSERKNKDDTSSTAQVSQTSQSRVAFGQYIKDNRSILLDSQTVTYPRVHMSQNDVDTSQTNDNSSTTVDANFWTYQDTQNPRKKNMKTRQSTNDTGLTLLNTKTVTTPGDQMPGKKHLFPNKSTEEIEINMSPLTDTDAVSYPNKTDVKQSKHLPKMENSNTYKIPYYMYGDQSGQAEDAIKGFKIGGITAVNESLESKAVVADSTNNFASQRNVSNLLESDALPVNSRSRSKEGFETLRSEKVNLLYPRLQAQKIVSSDNNNPMLKENALNLETKANEQSNELQINRKGLSNFSEVTGGPKEDTRELLTVEVSSNSTAFRDLTPAQKDSSKSVVSASESLGTLQLNETDAHEGDLKILGSSDNNKHSAFESISETSRNSQNSSKDFSSNLSGAFTIIESLDDTLSSSAFNADESLCASSVEQSYVREDPIGSSNASSPTSKQQPQLQDPVQQIIGQSPQFRVDGKDPPDQPSQKAFKPDSAGHHKTRKHGIQHVWAQHIKSETKVNTRMFKPLNKQHEEFQQQKCDDKGYFNSNDSQNTSLTQVQPSKFALKRWDQDMCEDLNIHSNYKKPLDVDVRKGIMYVQNRESDHVQRVSPELPTKGTPLRRKSVTFDKRNIQTDSDDTSLSRFFMGDQQGLSVDAKEPTFCPFVPLFNKQDNVLRGDKSPSEQSEIDMNDSASQREWRRSRSVHLHDGTKSKVNLTTNVHDMDTFRIQRRVSGQSKSQPKSSNTTESFGDESAFRVNVVGYDSNEEVALDRVKSWVTDTDSRVDLTSDINTRTDSPTPFDRHSIAEIPLKIITTTIPIDSDDSSITFKDNGKHTKLSASTSLGTCERKKESAKVEVKISPRGDPEGSEGLTRRNSDQQDNNEKTVLKQKGKSGSKISHQGADVIEMDDLGEQSRRTTRTLSNASVFDPAILDGWTPSSPYATRLQRNPSSRSEGSQNISGKPKVRQLSLAIGEEWEDMTGSQPPLSPDVFSNASSSYSHRSHRMVRTHQLSWAGSSEASWTGQPRTFRYMSHPARLENYLRRNTIVEEKEQPVTDQPETSADVEVSVEQGSERPADQPQNEKRWLLPNPYNKINQRFHSTLQCPCCLFFFFLCCLPAVYFMQISDKEFDHGTKEKARMYGKKATVLYVIGTIVAVILLTSVASVVVIFLQEYLTRKET